MNYTWVHTCLSELIEKFCLAFEKLMSMSLRLYIHRSQLTLQFWMYVCVCVCAFAFSFMKATYINHWSMSFIFNENIQWGQVEKKKCFSLFTKFLSSFSWNRVCWRNNSVNISRISSMIWRELYTFHAFFLVAEKYENENWYRNAISTFRNALTYLNSRPLVQTASWEKSAAAFTFYLRKLVGMHFSILEQWTFIWHNKYGKNFFVIAPS